MSGGSLQLREYPADGAALVPKMRAGWQTPLTRDDYLLLCLGSGEKISGSNTSLMSEFSVRYFWY